MRQGCGEGVRRGTVRRHHLAPDVLAEGGLPQEGHRAGAQGIPGRPRVRYLAGALPHLEQPARRGAAVHAENPAPLPAVRRALRGDGLYGLHLPPQPQRPGAGLQGHRHRTLLQRLFHPHQPLPRQAQRREGLRLLHGGLPLRQRRDLQPRPADPNPQYAAQRPV